METVLSRKVLHSAATTGNGAVADFKGLCKNLTLYVDGSAGISAGAVQLETASDPAYAGTWAAIGSPVTVTASTSKIVQQAGVFGAVRARISTNVTGGTVTVTLFAN